MPDQEGYILPSEQRRYSLENGNEPEKAKYRDKVADEILNDTFRGITKHERVIDNSFFGLANDDLKAAIECFRYGLFEPCTLMCRSMIDDALYISRYWKITKVDMSQYGGNAEWHSVAKGDKEEGKWSNLKERAVELGIDELKLAEILNLREEYGNYSAHKASKQMELNLGYARTPEEKRKEAKQPRWAISEDEAEKMLRTTAGFLIEVRQKQTQEFLNQKDVKSEK